MRQARKWHPQGIGFATEMLGWVGNDFGPPFLTTDGGMTWQVDPFGENINRFRFLGPNLAYAVGRTVYKYSTPTAVVKKTLSEIKAIYR